jgi:hypothetical protein
MWGLPTVIVSVLIGCWRAIKEVHHRVRGPQARARHRLGGDTSTVADRSIVTLTGTVRSAAAPMTAPLSGRSCVAYHSVATLYDIGRRHRRLRATIEEHRLTGFELDLKRDGMIVLIEGDRADLVEHPSPIIPRDLYAEQRFVTRHGHPAELARDGGFEEATIAVGDRVRVQGLALIEAHPLAEYGYRDGVTQIRIVAHAAHPLTIGRA